MHEVGSWADGKLKMDPKEVVWKKGSRVFPSSVCSLPCGIGEVKYMQQPREFLADEFTCQDCGIGNWPHENKTGCYALSSATTAGPVLTSVNYAIPVWQGRAVPTATTGDHRRPPATTSDKEILQQVETSGD
ncbi:unnamed protein product [Darwinula stevensoni]|uniref:Uncharacterized protein n=1 Tax=Darwinula stevensoni TaxID=69355 RepID=A0A7R9FR12_9CRUS|nr:unnamed protein product [Darwinula stevensoni]CAG0900535.1 unnamed protein product [Darwinula stevensoni]